MNVIKVSVESLDGKQNVLYEYDKRVSLEENVVRLLAKFEMPTKTNAYGLKLVLTNSGELLDRYLTDENCCDIKDGYFLKIAYAISHQVSTIFLLLEKGDRKTCFELISNLYMDQGFIKELGTLNYHLKDVPFVFKDDFGHMDANQEVQFSNSLLVKQEKHLVLLNFFVHQQDLTNEEAVSGLLTIIHLFRMGYIETVEEDFLEKLMSILKLDAELYTDQIKYSIALLQKIMSSRNTNMNEWKEMIIEGKPLNEITPYIRIQNQDLQYQTISLINTFVRYSSGLKRLHLIKEMNYKQTKEDIFKNIIERWPKLDTNMEYELYVYQTYLLSRLKHDEFNVIAAKIITLFPKEALGTYYVAPIKKNQSANGKSIPARGKLVDKCRNILYKAGERINKRKSEEQPQLSKQHRSEYAQRQVSECQLKRLSLTLVEQFISITKFRIRVQNNLYQDALTSKTKLTDDRRMEFELDNHHQGIAKRITKIIEFEENLTRIKSTENLMDIIEEEDRNSDTHSLSSTDGILRSSRNNLADDPAEEISYLTLGALAYYKKFHHKNFYQTQIDETFFGLGIFTTSESVVQILANVLQIGKEPEAKGTKCTFQPTVFNSSNKTPFFSELFSRSIWILSKTKNEMQGCSVPEYPKLMNVLEKQVKMVLEKRPGSFKKLTNIMLKTNYEAVKQKWQEENEVEFEFVLKHNPCVQELRKKYVKANEPLVEEQRMNYLKTGSIFYRVNDQKKIDHCFIKLFENRKQLLFYEFDEKLKQKKGDPEIINVANISHLVEGKACPHKINSITKDNRLIFSLIIEHTTYINIIAKDLKEGSYWLDGFHILLEKDERSEAFNKELNELVTMDLSLHLLELQNVTIPKKPPPVPPLPQLPERPPIPVKTLNLRLLKLKSNKGNGSMTIQI